MNHRITQQTKNTIETKKKYIKEKANITHMNTEENKRTEEEE